MYLEVNIIYKNDDVVNSLVSDSCVIPFNISALAM
jgi:hypothetical protein